MKLNATKLPTGIACLIPLAEKWGIADDIERTRAIESATRGDLEALVHCLDRTDATDFAQWLIGVESFRDPPSAEYIAMTSLTIAIEQARVRLKRMAWTGKGTDLFMSSDLKELLELMRKFVGRRVSVTEFAALYQVLWRRLRDCGSMPELNPYLQRAVDVVFTATDDADSPLHGRSLTDCEEQLRHDVSVVLSVIDGVERT